MRTVIASEGRRTPARGRFHRENIGAGRTGGFVTERIVEWDTAGRDEERKRRHWEG